MADTLTKEEALAVEAKVKELETHNYDEQIAALKSDLETAQKALKDLETEKGKSDEEVRKYAEQLATEQEDQRQGFVEAWIEENTPRMTPVERELATYLLDVLTLPPGSEVRAYAMEDDQKQQVELSPAEVFMAFIETRPEDLFSHLYQEVSEGGSTAGGGEPSPERQSQYEDPKREAIERAKVYAKEHSKGTEEFPLSKAYKLVLDEDPELKAAVAGVRPEGQDKAAEQRAVAERLYHRR